uniref:hypothetical protein n=1 Tax=Xenorhabdus sp. NBAII XenSa04 TaxID=1429873 RepID=UPI001E383F40
MFRYIGFYCRGWKLNCYRLIDNSELLWADFATVEAPVLWMSAIGTDCVKSVISSNKHRFGLHLSN